MAKIETRIGDATSPRPKKNGVIVAHLVNNKGAWGGGFVHALNDLSPVPAAAYKAWAAANQKDIPLGQVQFVEILPGAAHLVPTILRHYVPNHHLIIQVACLG